MALGGGELWAGRGDGLWAMGHFPDLKEGASLAGVTECFSNILMHSLHPLSATVGDRGVRE